MNQKEIPTQVFTVNSAEFSRKPILKNICERLLLCIPFFLFFSCISLPGLLFSDFLLTILLLLILVILSSKVLILSTLCDFLLMQEVILLLKYFVMVSFFIRCFYNCDIRFVKISTKNPCDEPLVLREQHLKITASSSFRILFS